MSHPCFENIDIHNNSSLTFSFVFLLFNYFFYFGLCVLVYGYFLERGKVTGARH